MKFKHLLSIFLVFVLCFGVCSFALADENAEVPEGYTPIYTAEDLYNIRNDLDGKYILMNDIDLSVYENWEPIGSSEEPFTGELDGNGYSIFNMTIKGNYTESDNLYFALFAYMTNGTVSDLNILNTKINVSYISSKIETFRIGILAGYANCVETKNCIVSGDITLNGFLKGAAGGLFGKENMCYPLNCINYADIDISAQKQFSDVSVGGIAGITTNDTVSQCSNYGDITVSGIDSTSQGRILKIGGVVGDNTNRGIVLNCINQGKVSVDFSMPLICVGGISGDCCVVENSYNIGNITVPTDFTGCVGGISGDFFPGGLAILPAPKIKNVYYINEGLFPSYIDGKFSDEDDFENTKLLTEEEFKNQNSFVGFDFENIWEMEENGYPVLQNQPVLPENIPERPTTTESTTESTTKPNTDSSTDSSAGSTESTMENTTESNTEPSTEEITEPSTEDITKPSTEPSDDECPLANLWIVKAVCWFLNTIYDAINNIIRML